MPLYSYRCPNGHVTDDIVPTDQRNDPIPCECCTEFATRIISPVRHEILFKPGYFATVGSHCETEMEFYNKRSKAVDKVVEDSYSVGGKKSQGGEK